MYNPEAGMLFLGLAIGGLIGFLIGMHWCVPADSEDEGEDDEL